jgi:hypothetical protein
MRHNSHTIWALPDKLRDDNKAVLIKLIKQYNQKSWYNFEGPMNNFCSNKFRNNDLLIKYSLKYALI